MPILPEDPEEALNVLKDLVEAEKQTEVALDAAKKLKRQAFREARDRRDILGTRIAARLGISRQRVSQIADGK